MTVLPSIGQIIDRSPTLKYLSIYTRSYLNEWMIIFFNEFLNFGIFEIMNLGPEVDVGGRKCGGGCNLRNELRQSGSRSRALACGFSVQRCTLNVYLFIS